MTKAIEKRRLVALKLAGLLEKAEEAMVELSRCREACGAVVSGDSQHLRREMSDYAAWLRQVDWSRP